MKGYLQELDTVNFNPDTSQGMLLGLFREAKVNTALYSVIYQVTLAPDQVLDSAWLRDNYSTVNPKAWPFIFTVHESVINNEHPFTSQLLMFLRRSGNQSFIFSSIPRNIELAKKWGEFMATESYKLADRSLLLEASKYYGEIVDWAKQLDSLYHDIVLQPYGRGPKFDELYRDYLTGLGFPYLKPPETRSEAYSRIATLQNVDLRAQFDTLKSVPDLISNVQYAINAQSRLILSSDSVLEHEIELPEDKDFIADIVLDLRGLLSEYGEIEKAIASSSFERIAEARAKTRRFVQEGWALLEARDFDRARKRLGEGLMIFARELVQQEMPTFPILITFEPSIVPGQPLKFKMEIPPVNAAVYLQWFIKWKLRGLDKFINIRKPAG